MCTFCFCMVSIMIEEEQVIKNLMNGNISILSLKFNLKLESKSRIVFGGKWWAEESYPDMIEYVVAELLGWGTFWGHLCHAVRCSPMHPSDLHSA